MAQTTLRVRKFSLKKVQLANLPDAERNLFFLSGHILNELNSLNKVFAWSLQNGDEGESQTSRLARGAQSMIYARVLAGKLSEAWQALGPTWFSKALSPAVADGLHPDSRAALAALKVYFNRPSLIFKVRNSFAFHYSAKGLGAHWEDAAHGDDLQVVIGGSIGNNVNLAAEILTNAAIFRVAHPTDLECGMQAFLGDVQAVAGHFTTFLEGVTVVLLKATLGELLADQGIEEEIVVNQSFSEVRIPYFCAPDSKKGA